MDPKDYPPKDIETLRTRAKYEDKLLNSRTNIVLVFNGLLAAAANIASFGQGNIPAVFGIAGFALLFNVLWLPCALQHGSYMGLLSRIIRESDHKPVDEKVRFEHQKKRLYGPTGFMTIIMPILLAVGWALWILLKVKFPPIG